MRILISNDDGYLAPGINALAAELANIADIIVVAPDSNRSASSNSLTLHRPVSVYQASNGYYYTNGTPSDCVHIAITANNILPWKPDLIVSGINHGQNMGDDTLYSGTVAAATEGFLFGIPAIAFSQVERGWKEIDSAAKMARDIVERLYPALSKPFLLNVNIPNSPYAEFRSIQATRLGKRHQSTGVIQQMDPFGREIFWIGPSGSIRDAGEGTDFYATQNGHVSVTPLQIDWTYDSALGDLRKALDE